MELVQTFCTIEFAIVENPQNHLQNQKYHSQKKLGLPEFNLNMVISEVHCQMSL